MSKGKARSPCPLFLDILAIPANTAHKQAAARRSASNSANHEARGCPRTYLGGGARLLDDVLDDVVRRAAPAVVGGLAVLEELERGESAHAVLLGEVLVFVAVHLWDRNETSGGRKA